MKRLSLVFVLASVSVVAGCRSTLPDVVSSLNPFKIDIRQGNYVSQDMVAQLKPGQTRDQVRFILGSPLVDDIFHANRWDYVYRFQPGRGPAQQRRLTVYFEEDRLVRVSGDVVAGDGNAEPSKPAVQTLEIVGDKPKSSSPAVAPAADASAKQ